jgi:hypothetical protein
LLIAPRGRETDRPDDVAALALIEARGIIGHEAAAGTIDLRQRIDVEDERGKVVHSISFEDAVTIER